MNHTSFSRMVYLSALTALATPIVWAAFWYNKGAFSVLNSATQQMCLYLLPMLPIGIMAWRPKVHPVPFVVFFCIMTPLLALTYTQRDGIGWLYSLMALPVIWSFGVFACISIAKSSNASDHG
ncbi:MAG: hypothetical protein V4484_16630 [Pseudomonadota bacterium]